VTSHGTPSAAARYSGHASRGTGCRRRGCGGSPSGCRCRSAPRRRGPASPRRPGWRRCRCRRCRPGTRPRRRPPRGHGSAARASGTGPGRARRHRRSGRAGTQLGSVSLRGARSPGRVVAGVVGQSRGQPVTGGWDGTRSPTASTADGHRSGRRRSRRGRDLVVEEENGGRGRHTGQHTRRTPHGRAAPSCRHRRVRRVTPLSACFGIGDGGLERKREQISHYWSAAVRGRLPQGFGDALVGAIPGPSRVLGGRQLLRDGR
jgi:hypothetical protein